MAGYAAKLSKPSVKGGSCAPTSTSRAVCSIKTLGMEFTWVRRYRYEEKQEAILVASRSILEYGVRHPQGYNEGLYTKLKISESHERSHNLAVKAGTHSFGHRSWSKFFNHEI